MASGTQNRIVNVVSPEGITLVRQSGDGENQVLMQAGVDQILEELGIQGLLAWTIIGQLRDVTRQLRAFNQRAEQAARARPADQLQDMLGAISVQFPQMEPVIRQFLQDKKEAQA